ncbi:MAG: hypothetical protein PHC53_05255 [Patescibacteria group bacterium]|nr:hypothetical protein [Patescibacteria group bacterium]
MAWRIRTVLDILGFYYIVNLWFAARRALETFRTDMRMLRQLWPVTPEDCRTALVGELIFSPRQLRRRFAEECDFNRNLDGRWL